MRGLYVRVCAKISACAYAVIGHYPASTVQPFTARAMAGGAFMRIWRTILREWLFAQMIICPWRNDGRTQTWERFAGKPRRSRAALDRGRVSSHGRALRLGRGGGWAPARVDDPRAGNPGHHHAGGRCAWGGEEAGHRRGLTIHGRGTRGTIIQAPRAPGSTPTGCLYRAMRNAQTTRDPLTRPDSREGTALDNAKARARCEPSD